MKKEEKGRTIKRIEKKKKKKKENKIVRGSKIIRKRSKRKEH